MSARIHHRRALLGAVAVTAVLAVAGFATSQAWGQSTGTAAATTTPAPADQLTKAKDGVEVSIDRRLAAIDKASAAVPTDAGLSAAERAAVTADLASLKSGFVALKTKVDADSTVAAIKADVKAAHAVAKATSGIEAAALYVRASDATAYLDSVAGRVAAIQSKLKSSGPALNNALSDIQAKVTEARSHLSGFDTALLSPEPPSQAQVSAASTTLKAVAGDLTAIRKDVKSLRQARGAANHQPAAG